MHKVRRGRGRDKLYLGFERTGHFSSALRPSFDIAERVTAGWLSGWQHICIAELGPARVRMSSTLLRCNTAQARP
jgi:hypothetical protein